MKSFLLSILLIALSKSQDCSMDNIGLTSIEPRGLPEVPEDTPVEDPNTEPFTTNSTMYYSSTSVTMETGTIDVNSVSVPYTTVTTEVPNETGSVVVNDTPIYTETTGITGTTEVPNETGSVVVNDTSIYTTTVMEPETTDIPVETEMTTAITVTETVNEQQVTQSTCEYSMETIKTIVLKTIYVNTCVVDDEFKQLSEPVNCTLEM